MCVESGLDVSCLFSLFRAPCSSQLCTQTNSIYYFYVVRTYLSVEVAKSNFMCFSSRLSLHMVEGEEF